MVKITKTGMAYKKPDLNILMWIKTYPGCG